MYWKDGYDMEEGYRPERNYAISFGNYLIIDKIFDELYLKDIARQVFDFSDDLFLDLVAYCLISEYSERYLYETYVESHALFTENMKIHNEEEMLRFLDTIDDDCYKKFFELWNKDISKKDRIYVHPYESTSNYNPGYLTFTNIYEDLPEIGDFLCYDKENKKPLFYCESELTMSFDSLNQLGYENTCYIFDRGTYILNDIQLLEKSGADTLFVIEGQSRIVRNIILKNRGSFEQHYFRVPNNRISGTTVLTKVFLDDNERYVHIYYDKKKQEEEAKTLDWRVNDMLRYAEKQIGQDSSNLDCYRRYLNVITDENDKIVKTEIIQEAIDEDFSLTGYSCIITSYKEDYRKVWKIYHNKDIWERVFSRGKHFASETSIFYYADDKFKEQRVFIEFVALIVKEKIKERLNGLMPTDQMIEIMMDIRLHKGFFNRKGFLVDDLTREQKKILLTFGIDEKYFEKKFNYISKVAYR